MMRHILQIDMNQLRNVREIDYRDDSVAFHFNVAELPMVNGSMRVGMCMIVACSEGRMQVDVNTKGYVLQRNGILVCRPNDVIENCMMTPGFKGAVLCLSRKFMVDQIAINQLWNSAFHLARDPIVTVNEHTIRMIHLYGHALYEKVRMPQTTFSRESILSIVKALLYELLDYTYSKEKGQASYVVLPQGDVLFRNFIHLIADSKVKPRTVMWYAGKLCITPKHLSAVCRKVSGRSAYHWINEYVKKDIRSCLKNTDQTIKEVTDTLGFPSISFFGKYCHRNFGCSPSELRRRLRLPDCDLDVGLPGSMD